MYNACLHSSMTISLHTPVQFYIFVNVTEKEQKVDRELFRPLHIAISTFFIHLINCMVISNGYLFYQDTAIAILLYYFVCYFGFFNEFEQIINFIVSRMKSQNCNWVTIHITSKLQHMSCGFIGTTLEKFIKIVANTANLILFKHINMKIQFLDVHYRS